MKFYSRLYTDSRARALLYVDGKHAKQTVSVLYGLFFAALRAESVLKANYAICLNAHLFDDHVQPQRCGKDFNRAQLQCTIQ